MTTFIVTLVATLAAGAVGAVLRAAVVFRAPRAGTAAVNLAGTLLLAGVVLANGRGALGDPTAVILGVGLSGSLTTFSGWVALVADGLDGAPLRTIVVDVMLPLLTAVGLTVLVFAVVT